MNPICSAAPISSSMSRDGGDDSSTGTPAARAAATAMAPMRPRSAGETAGEGDSSSTF